MRLVAAQPTSRRGRLAVFVSAAWVLLWVSLFAIDGQIGLGGIWIFGVMPVAFIWGILWVIRGTKPEKHSTSADLGVGASSALPTASTWAYVFSAFLLGMLTATAQRLDPIGSAEWWGASLAPLIFGAILGFIIRIFRKPTDVAKVAFWWSVITLIIAAAQPRS